MTTMPEFWIMFIGFLALMGIVIFFLGKRGDKD